MNCWTSCSKSYINCVPGVLARKKKTQMTYDELQEDLNIPRSSLQYICEGRREGKPKRRGRPSKLGPRTKSLIKRECARLQERRELATANKIKLNLGLDISKRTIQRVLKQKEASYLAVPKIFPLSTRAKNTRMALVGGWIQQQINFSKVIFTDESRFAIDGPDHLLTWQLDDRPRLSRDKLPVGGGGVMVWGCISSDGQVFIQRLPSNITGEIYSEFIQGTIFPMLREKFGEDFIWQQDNAPPHTARITIDTLEENRIQVLDWPPYSPDLNPIENLWVYLKRNVYEISRPQTLDHLWDRIQAETEKINRNNRGYVQHLYEGIGGRIWQVIANKGDRIGK